MIAFYIIWITYSLFVLGLIIVWLKIGESKTKSTTNLGLSVIIPIRNEEKNIKFLLADLNQQTYSSQYFEVIVVNDHSTDNSKEEALEASRDIKYLFEIIDLPENQTGKKSAISAGIQVSQFNTIITTDGDCRVDENWLESINNAYEKNVVLVFGIVQYFPIKNIFQSFQALELSALTATGAATHYLGLPGMCNGANFSFNKKVFNEVNGYSGNENLPTGDDEFLFRKIREKYPNGIRLMKNSESIVRTSPQGSWVQFINQKVRWASKWKYHNDRTTTLLGVFIFGCNMLFLVLLGLTVASAIPRHYFLWVITLKAILEYILAMVIINPDHKIKYVISSIFLSLLYPFYAIFIGVLSFKGKYYWKGRSY